MAYIINYEDGGWVIVCANRDYYPILAYSDKGRFEMAGVYTNGGLQIWLDEVSLAIRTSDSLDTDASNAIALEWMQFSVDAINEPGLPSGNTPEAIMCRNRMKELNDIYYADGWTFKTLNRVNDITLPDKVYQIADQYNSPYEYTIVGIRDISVHTNVDPLLTTEWHQNEAFNGMCQNNSKAGCVPIAMAQIMNFHKYPSKFDWENMHDFIATKASQYLIYDVGHTIGADYGQDKTSASLEGAVSGFKTYGYSATLKDHNIMDVIQTLKGPRNPIFMSGRTSKNMFETDGHAWVCDGAYSTLAEYEYYVEYIYNGNSYENFGETFIESPGHVGGLSYTRLHMNWGWINGEHNGYYVGVAPTSDKDYKHSRKNIYVTIN